MGDAVNLYRDIILEKLKDKAHFAAKTINMPSGASVAELGLSEIKKRDDRGCFKPYAFLYQQARSRNKFRKEEFSLKGVICIN